MIVDSGADQDAQIVWFKTRNGVTDNDLLVVRVLVNLPVPSDGELEVVSDPELENNICT